MKEFLLLYKSNFSHYNPMRNNIKSGLWDLNTFFSGDYRPYDQDLFKRVVSSYNITFVYNDFEKKMMYIGFSEWELSDGEMHCPDDEEFPNYVNVTNSCKMSVDNFIEFTKKWLVIKEALPPFAIMYRDNNDWVDCKGFDSKKEMEQFVKDHQLEIVH